MYLSRLTVATTSNYNHFINDILPYGRGSMSQCSGDIYELRGNFFFIRIFTIIIIIVTNKTVSWRVLGRRMPCTH